MGQYSLPIRPSRGANALLPGVHAPGRSLRGGSAYARLHLGAGPFAKRVGHAAVDLDPDVVIGGGDGVGGVAPVTENNDRQEDDQTQKRADETHDSTLFFDSPSVTELPEVRLRRRG